MRIFPVIIAAVVLLAVFFIVFQRDETKAAIGVPAESTQTTTDGTTSADTEGTQPEDTETAGAVGVIAVHSTARAIDSAVTLRGQTEADRQVDVRAETSGAVISNPLRKGNFVNTGDLLCKLDPANRAAVLAEAEARLSEAKSRVPEAEARVTQAKALIEEARINDNAAVKLSRGGYASDTRVASTKAAVSTAEATLQSAISGLEATEAGIQAAQATIEAAKKEIDRLDIRAPFDGLLESDTAEIGSLLQPGALCATVIQLDPIVLVGFVTETDVLRLSQGATASAQTVAGHEVTGTVTFVSRSADPNTRTFRVEIEVDNPDLTLRDGQTVEIEIAADGKKAHLLPQSALTLNDSGTLGVRVVDDNSQALFVPVEFLKDTGKGMWLGGLPEEANVIIIGQEYVIDGVPVRASYQDVAQ